LVVAASLLRLGGWRSVGALVVVAAAAAGIGQTGAGHALLEKAGLIQRPSGYTALSFKAPDTPVNVTSAGKREHYALTVNIQNTNTTSRGYRLSVLLVQRPGHARRIKTRSSAFVGPGKTASIPLAGSITCERDHLVEFIVQLAGSRPPEAIHAWATCHRPRV
jgi:hypothetical protein